MGKASSAKKVARAARAGGNRRAGQRRALGFPIMIGAVLVLGLLLVFFARDRRNADAFPRANKDHVHSAFDIYTCVQASSDTASTTTTSSTATTDTTATTAPSTDASASSDSTTTSTTSTTLPDTSTSTSTTLANPNDVHGEYAPPVADVQTDVLGIHSHGDGLIHIHPFSSSSAGRKATMGVFLDQVGVSITDTELTLPSGTKYTEGTTKCEGGKDGQVQIAKWDKATDAAAGAKPNQIFTSGFDKIRLGANQAYTVAFMPEGSTIPAKADVADRIAKVTDLGTTTTSPSSDSGAPSSDSGAPTSAPDTSTPDAGTPSSESTTTSTPSN